MNCDSFTPFIDPNSFYINTLFIYDPALPTGGCFFLPNFRNNQACVVKNQAWLFVQNNHETTSCKNVINDSQVLIFG